MRMCMDHWGQLRAAIDQRGLSSLIAQGGEAAAKNLACELTDGPTIDNFDPLMAAHNAIFSNATTVAVDAVGKAGLFELMSDDNEGKGCPICFLNAKHKAACGDAGCIFGYDEWIDRAADDALAAWKAMGQ